MTDTLYNKKEKLLQDIDFQVQLGTEDIRNKDINTIYLSVDQVKNYQKKLQENWIDSIIYLHKRIRKKG